MRYEESVLCNSKILEELSDGTIEFKDLITEYKIEIRNKKIYQISNKASKKPVKEFRNFTKDFGNTKRNLKRKKTSIPGILTASSLKSKRFFSNQNFSSKDDANNEISIKLNSKTIGHTLAGVMPSDFANASPEKATGDASDLLTFSSEELQSDSQMNSNILREFNQNLTISSELTSLELISVPSTTIISAASEKIPPHYHIPNLLILFQLILRLL